MNPPDASLEIVGPLGKLCTREPLTDGLLEGVRQQPGVEAVVQLSRYSAYFQVATLHDPKETAKQLGQWIVDYLAEQQQVQATLEQVARDSEKI